MKFHHVAMAVHDIQEAQVGLPLTGITFDPEQGAYLQLLNVGGLPIELVQGGPVADWLKRGCKLYHICFEVDDLDLALEESSGRGSAVVSTPKPAVLFGGRRVAFIMDRSLGLIEYLEKSS